MYTTIVGALALLAGYAGFIILRDVNKSEHDGKPVSMLIRQLMFITFPGANENSNPYLGAIFMGCLLAMMGVFGVVGIVATLATQ